MQAVTELIWHGSYGNTTVDQICEKAGVKKGTFYYFFDSKSELAVAAIEQAWEAQKLNLDAIFSPTIPPLDRIQAFCDRGMQKQVEMKKQCGCVLGCPLFTLGAEVCNHEVKLHAKIKEILGHYHTYLESAIRDASAANLIKIPDAAVKARMIFAYSEGLLTQARILNDVEVLREMPEGIWAILGVTRLKKAA